MEERTKGLDRAETEEAAAFIEGSGRRMSELDFGRREKMQQAQWAMRDSSIGTLRLRYGRGEAWGKGRLARASRIGRKERWVLRCRDS